MKTPPHSLLAALLALALPYSLSAKDLSPPDPAKNPESALMLTGDWLPEDTHQIDYSKLPKIPSEHVVVCDVRAQKGVNQHNYLIHHKGQFYIMWSDGPAKEDRVGQRVKFATSPDGLDWSEPEYMTPIPPGSGPDSPHNNTRTDKGHRWISRGFWEREGELYALVSFDEAAGFFGPGLELHAFQLQADGSWKDTGVIAKNAINNFPPKKISTGDWMMSRRPYNYKDTETHFMVGGVKSIDDWESYPVLGTNSELAAEEPLWWMLPDKGLMALFRDNRRSGYIYRSFSTDDGRTWSKPIQTNFPDARSKIHGFQLADGRYVLVSNSNPRKRDPLTLAISDGGMVFNKLGWLVGNRHVDYPHSMQHGEHLYVAFAGFKETVEVLKIRISDLDFEMPDNVELPEPLPDLADVVAADRDWIDLGVNGTSVHLACHLEVPPAGERASLVLATNKGDGRVTVGVDAESRLFTEVYEGHKTGPALTPGDKVSLLLKLNARQPEPDQLFVQLGDAGTIPTPADTAEGWALVNATGSSEANLSKLIPRGDSAKPAFSQVRIATSYEKLAATEPLPLTTTHWPWQLWGDPASMHLALPAPEDPKLAHLAWPKIVTTPKGTVVLASSAGVGHNRGGSGLVVARSTDAGDTFSEPQLLCYFPDDDERYRDCGNMALGTAEDGSLVLLAMAFTPETHSTILGWRSTDEGQTWTRTDTSHLDENQTGSTYGHVIQVPGKGLAVFGHYRLPSPDAPGIWMSMSTDNGQSWGPAQKITGGDYVEPAFTFADNKFIGLLRVREDQRFYDQAVSENYGETWSIERTVIRVPEGQKGSQPSPFITVDPSDPNKLYALQSIRGGLEDTRGRVNLWSASAKDLDWEMEGPVFAIPNTLKVMVDWSYPWMTPIGDGNWKLVFYAGDKMGANSIYGMTLNLNE